MPRSATQAFPVRRFPSITHCRSCPTFASHNSILGNTQDCSCSMMMTDKESLSHATCKRTDTVFSKFTKPNFLSKLRHWLSPSSTSSPHFTRVSVFANSHLVHALRCKTRKPTEKRTVICDTYTFVLLSGKSKSLHCRFTSLTAISTRPLTLRNHFHSYTRVNHRILECLRSLLIIAYQNDSAKATIFGETHQK